MRLSNLLAPLYRSVIARASSTPFAESVAHPSLVFDSDRQLDPDRAVVSGIPTGPSSVLMPGFKHAGASPTARSISQEI